MSVGAIIQARMGSQRLPGKVLLELPFASGISVLDNIIARATRVESIQTLIVATTQAQADDLIEKHCLAAQIKCFRGDNENVLARFYQAALEMQLSTIIRLTADNPCYDSQLIAQTLQTHLHHQNDYTCTENYPLGLNLEIFSFSALERCYQQAVSAYEREHVTPYIYQTNPAAFQIETLFAATDNSHLRLTLDTQADYLLQCALYDYLFTHYPYFGLNEIVNLLQAKPWLKYLNSHIQQKKSHDSLESEIESAIDLLEKHELFHSQNYLKTYLKSEKRGGDGHEVCNHY